MHKKGGGMRTRKLRLPSGRWITVKPSPYRRHWAVLANMPRLDHWPDRDTQDFDPKRSEVFKFIRENCGVNLKTAACILGSANRNGFVRFETETLTWIGTGKKSKAMPA